MDGSVGPANRDTEGRGLERPGSFQSSQSRLRVEREEVESGSDVVLRVWRKNPGRLLVARYWLAGSSGGGDSWVGGSNE